MSYFPRLPLGDFPDESADAKFINSTPFDEYSDIGSHKQRESSLIKNRLHGGFSQAFLLVKHVPKPVYWIPMAS